ncbi:HAMP domain-containing histidine kinase [Pseudomonas phytophila]|uniref:histidine kinase n=1 Tax=Pseudomonas phytophila TaxID=2867264 RepID=A0ABY6FM53_9PSED|nr:HAMP domain-containing sensor histidine kinase [Pseudomonas phytophila]MDG6401644.1 HAMP domain-containing sensor histidine kinase [Pseudomonas quasicaspiana]UXZ99027.1 HAMP domain-containing histidine kinase [Pseudomonas phytophila]
MDIKHSLKQRIVIVFTLMSTLVALIFAAGIVVTVHLVGKKLTALSMNGDLHRLLLMDDVANWTHRPEKDSFFYIQDASGLFAMPESLKPLKPGFHRIKKDNVDYYAMVDMVDGRQYVLLRDQTATIQRERILFAIVLVGFVLSVLLALLLGRLLAQRVMAPVVKLAGEVRDRDQAMDAAPTLATNYAHDEVGELAVSFDETLGRLRAALTREKMFTSDVSHELRTPLMVLASSCELLLENPAVDPRSRNQVLRISRASEGMRQLVETFLLLARIDTEVPGHGPRATLVAVADELVDMWRKPIEEKGLTLRYEPGVGSDRLYNATLLHSVMSNLLRNAWHYTDEGFIFLSLKGDRFSVEDSGIGIPLEKQQAMFQPFVRGDEQRGEGLGLGLSLVQRICVHQGWSVNLESRIPQGCCFEVSLSASAVSADRPDSVRKPASASQPA